MLPTVIVADTDDSDGSSTFTSIAPLHPVNVPRIFETIMCRATKSTLECAVSIAHRSLVIETSTMHCSCARARPPEPVREPVHRARPRRTHGAPLGPSSVVSEQGFTPTLHGSCRVACPHARSGRDRRSLRASLLVRQVSGDHREGERRRAEVDDHPRPEVPPIG
jgi:hypothetical protein